MKNYFLILLCFFSFESFSQTYSFTHNSITRTYIVHLPAGYSASNQYPVVINMHGYTSTASQQQAYSQMDLVADTAKFIVVYPDGVSNAWNGGFGVNSNIDDVGFISALIDTMKNNFSVNADKIFACGMSAGGFMSYRLACELSNKIAGIASVTGLMADSVRLFLCQNPCNVPVMDFHGTTDPIVNYNGALGYISADSCIQWWRIKDGCPPAPLVTSIPDINTTDGCTATKYYYSFGNDSAEVVFFKITNGGHTWPGGIPIPSFGNTCQDIKASGEIWNFFKKHSLKCGVNAVHELSVTGNQLSVHPNPTTGEFTVDGLQLQMSVYNVLGEKIYDIPNGERVVHLPLGLGKGIYFLKSETEKGTSVIKLLKN